MFAVNYHLYVIVGESQVLHHPTSNATLRAAGRGNIEAEHDPHDATVGRVVRMCRCEAE